MGKDETPDSTTLRIKNSLAVTKIEQGKYSEACRMLEEIYEVEKIQKGEEDEDCYSSCRSPCSVEAYKTNLNYYPLDVKYGNQTRLTFALDFEEAILLDQPKQTLIVLLPAFGGILGFLAGVSVLSMVELFIWTFLFIAEKCAQFYARKIRPWAPAAVDEK